MMNQCFHDMGGSYPMAGSLKGSGGFSWPITALLHASLMDAAGPVRDSESRLGRVVTRLLVFFCCQAVVRVALRCTAALLVSCVSVRGTVVDEYLVSRRGANSDHHICPQTTKPHPGKRTTGLRCRFGAGHGPCKQTAAANVCDLTVR